LYIQGLFRPYDITVQKQLEDAYKQKLPSVQLTIDAASYKIDFANMFQESLGPDKTQSAIRRIDLLQPQSPLNFPGTSMMSLDLLSIAYVSMMISTECPSSSSSLRLLTARRSKHGHDEPSARLHWYIGSATTSSPSYGPTTRHWSTSSNEYSSWPICCSELLSTLAAVVNPQPMQSPLMGFPDAGAVTQGPGGWFWEDDGVPSPSSLSLCLNSC